MDDNRQFLCCLKHGRCLFFHVFSEFFNSVNPEIHAGFNNSFCNFIQQRRNALNIFAVDRGDERNIKLVQRFFQKIVAFVFEAFCGDDMVFCKPFCYDFVEKNRSFVADLCAFLKQSIKNFFFRG